MKRFKHNSICFFLKAFGGVILLALAGCAAVGPDYVSSGTSLPAAWHSSLDGGLTSGENDPSSLARWWTTLNDPELCDLMERAVSGNLTVKEALSRLREARAYGNVSRADLFPTLDMSGSATQNLGSRQTGLGKLTKFYTAGFDSRWEWDLFGGVRRSLDAAEAKVGASQEEVRDALVSLVAEVAVNYVEVRTYQAQLAVAEKNLRTQDDTFELTRWRYEAGLDDVLAVEQARYGRENIRSQIPSLHSGLEEVKNRLAVLLGEQPGALHSLLEQTKSIPLPPPESVVGVPAEVLRHRPDVRQAERALAAQTAQVGVAVAELYPKFVPNGSIGLESLSLGDLFSHGSRTYSLGPQISWPIFHAGAIRQNIEVQSALQEQALIAYEATLLASLEEVENALVAYVDEQARQQSLSTAVDAAESAAKLAQDRYAAGLIDFLVVLDAQRSVYSLQSQRVESEGMIITDVIALYKALGGGWTPLTSGPSR